MKKLYTLLAAAILTTSVFAQAPEKMSYQAVVRDAGNELVTSQAVGMQISILQGSVSGTAVYVETQTPTTNINGLVSLEIGSGTVVSGTFNTIDWSNGPYFIKTETDPTGGTSYTIIGTSQLMSVPYAFHAKTAERIVGTTGQESFANARKLKEKTNNKKLQDISLAGTNLTISGGSTIDLSVIDTDTDTQLDETAVDGFVSNNGYLTSEVDGDVTNEIQDLNLTGNILTITVNEAATDIDLSPYLDNTDTQLDETAVDGFVSNNGYLTSEVDGSITNEIELPTTANAGDMNYWNGSAWVTIPATPIDGATLQMISGVPTWTGGTPPPAIGDFRDGGVVFWLDGSGGGLVCAVSDQSNIQWGSFTVTNATGSAIGTGQTNTAIIVANQGLGSYAAKLCDDLSLNGFSDWFLPSKDELNEMWENRTTIDATALANGGGGFEQSVGHWSSTEFNFVTAWIQVFFSGGQGFNDKSFPRYVRAVRAF